MKTNQRLKSRNVLLGTLYIALVTIFATTSLHSCIEDPISTPSGEEKMITFSVQVPGGFTPNTYGFTDDDENSLKTVDVILFKDGNYFSGPHYGVISDEKDGTGKVAIAIKIPDGTATYSMSVFANCRSKLSTANLTGAKENVFKTILESRTNGTAWSTATSGSPATPVQPIPMWGEADVSVSNNVVSGVIDIKLIRMLSRINVYNSAGNFTLTSVNLYNYNTSGRIAPVTTNIENFIAKSTSLPESVAKGTTSISYPVANSKCENEIYTFEASTVDGYDKNNPCIVIGGTYSGGTYYYRIDFVDDNDKYLPLLRNHTYDVNVSGVSGPGYDNINDAYAARPVNVSYTVQSWNGGKVGGVTTDGQYKLGVSAATLDFDATARSYNDTDETNLITVFTDYSTTVTLDRTGTADWLKVHLDNSSSAISHNASISLTSGTPNSKTLRLVFADNSAGSARSTSFKLKSGRMEYVVNVTQSNKLPTGIVVAESNCYIVPPDGAILIPVSHAYKALNTIDGNGNSTADATLPANWFSGGGENFSSQFVWKDNKNLSLYHTVIGSGKSAYLYVRPILTNQEGNAVIAIKNSSGIRWSWHIWVTNYTPTNGGQGVFMNRNLGALYSGTSSGGQAGKAKDVFGLLYQWGRKDPFPGSADYSGETSVTLYNESGQSTVPVSIQTVTAAGSLNNLQNSIINPSCIYTSGENDGGRNDWYTNGTTYNDQNNRLWGGWDGSPQTKSVYDPCPPGWRVPRSTHITPTNWTSPWATMDTATGYGNGNGQPNSGYWRPTHGGWYSASGCRWFSNAGIGAGTYGYYWSASPIGSNRLDVRYLCFNSGFISPHFDGGGRASCMSVRCCIE